MRSNAQMLKDISHEQFQLLADGGHRFSIKLPNGLTGEIGLDLSGRRRKYRLAQFDFWSTNYNIAEAADSQFCRELRAALQNSGSIPPGTIVVYPTGGASTLTFSLPPDRQGYWLYRAAEYLCDTTNLYSIRPAWERAS